MITPVRTRILIEVQLPDSPSVVLPEGHKGLQPKGVVLAVGPAVTVTGPGDLVWFVPNAALVPVAHARNQFLIDESAVIAIETEDQPS
jgi:co-chaperonin GroES (HSP10)